MEHFSWYPQQPEVFDFDKLLDVKIARGKPRKLLASWLTLIVFVSLQTKNVAQRFLGVPEVDAIGVVEKRGSRVVIPWLQCTYIIPRLPFLWYMIYDVVWYDGYISVKPIPCFCMVYDI